MKTINSISKQQLGILTLIYRFRFVNSKQVQQHLGQKHIRQAVRCLSLLVERKYIGRNYSASDSLTGQYGSYYLLAEGLRVLKDLQPAVDPTVIHNIYNDKVASQRFQQHCLAVGEVFRHLIRMYEDDIEIFSLSELVKYGYFPQTKFDGYATLQTKARSGKQKQYFLVVCDDSEPLFVLQRTIRWLVDYIDNRTWQKATNEPSPTTLLVCDNSSMKRYMLETARKAVDAAYLKDVWFLATTKQQLSEAMAADAIWESQILEANMTRLR